MRDSDIREFGPYLVNSRTRVLTRDGEPVPLPAKAFDVLLELLKTPGETVTKDHLMSAVWPGTFVEDGNLTQMIFLLRKALGDADAASPHIVTVPRQGYRFVGEIKSTPENEPPPHAALKRTVGVLTIAAICSLLTFGIWVLAKPSEIAVIRALAVFPFDDLSPGKDMDYFCQGMAGELIEALSLIPSLHVTARASASEVKKDGKIREAGKLLGVQAVLDGAVQRDGDRLRVTVELLDRQDLSRLWSETYDGKISDLFTVQRSIARNVAERLRLRVGERLYTPRRYTANSEIYDLYLRGRSGAPAYCQQAVDRDPAYAPAYSCLADAYAGMWTAGVDPSAALMRARGAAEKALALDPELAEAHLSQAHILLADWDWAGALAATDKAIALAPSFGPALWRRANLLLYTGRHDEAQIAFARAEAIDPMSPDMVRQKLQGLFCMRRYDDTLAFAKKHLSDSGALYYSARAYAAKGMLQEAVHEYEEYRRQSNKRTHGYGALADLYVRAGRRSDALKLVEEVNERAKYNYVRPVSTAQLYLGIGDVESAFRWLHKAYDQNDSMLQFLKVEPCWDPLRSDPRFQSLLRKVKLQL